MPELVRAGFTGVHNGATGIVKKEADKMPATTENSERNSHISRIVIIAGVAMAKYRDHVYRQAVGAVAEFVQPFGAFAKAVAAIHAMQGEIQQQILATTANAFSDGFQHETGQFQLQLRGAEFNSGCSGCEYRCISVYPGSNRASFPQFRQYCIRVLMQISDLSIFKPQAQATFGNICAANPQLNAMPG